MKTLFNISLGSKSPAVIGVSPPTQDAQWPSQEDFQSLDNFITGYSNATTLYDEIASESYTLVDHKNRALYNAYASLLSDRLGVDAPRLRTVTLESVQNTHPIALNNEIALEGWIATFWEKIKGVFTKIYDAIRAFFVRHFTRLGKAKKALENLKELLEKTDKNIKDPGVENYTGKLLKVYAGYGQVNANAVKQSVINVGRFTQGLTSINQKAQVVVDKHMLDKDFFAKIKALKDKAQAADTVRKGVDDSTPGRKLFGNDERAAKIKESKSLASISSDAKKQAAGMDNEAEQLGVDDKGTSEANSEAAKADMTAFLEEVKKTIGVSVDSKLIGGIVIKGVTVSAEIELEVEVGEQAEDAKGLYLGAKSDLLTLVKQGLDMVKVAEGSSAIFTKINDAVMKNLDAIDGLVSDIDKVDPEKYGRYKKLVNEQVRERLNLMRKFFSSYNKVGKNIFDYNLQCCEGVVEYSVLSVKNFG